MATLEEIVEAMADALAPVKAAIPDLQLAPIMITNPTPPVLDIYPDTPFQNGSGFGEDADVFFVVRARTTTADHEAGQRALYRMLDPTGPESVRKALEADQTLCGTVQTLTVVPEGVSGFTEYVDDAYSGGKLIGCQWRFQVIT